MKNIYQKVIAILYLIVVAGLSFYSPLYKYKGRIVPISDGIGGYNHNNSDLEFGSLWSNQVDWFKFGYIFFFINLLFILLFYFFRNKPNPDVNSPTFKRKLKRELKVFAIGIIAFFAFLGFIEVFNLYQENKKEKITEEIYERNLWLSDHISKRPPIKLVDEYGIPIKKRIVPKPSDVLKKSSFTPPSDALVVKKNGQVELITTNIITDTHEDGKQLTVSEFSAKIKAKYPVYKEWDDLVLAKKIVEKYPEYKDNVVFDEFASWKKLKSYMKNKKYGDFEKDMANEESLKKIHEDLSIIFDGFTISYEEFKKDMTNKENLKKLHGNLTQRLDEFDSEAYLKSKEYTDKIKELNSERDKLFYFVGDGYTKSVFLFLIIELLVLYILRYVFYGVRSLNNYLKDE